MDKPQTPLDVLKAARELISDPAKWTKGGYAFAGEAPTDIKDPAATCFCTLGAVARVSDLSTSDVVGEQLLITLGGDPEFEDATIVVGDEWNDDPKRTHAEVLDLFDRTIARLEASHA